MSLFFHKLFRCRGLWEPKEAFDNPFTSVPVTCSVCGQLWECTVEVDCAAPGGGVYVCWDKVKKSVEDGPEIEIIRREQEVYFMDWCDSLPERWEKVWAIAIEFVKKWNPDVR